MNSVLKQRVGARSAMRLVAFANRARDVLPMQVVDVLLFGSRARGEAKRGSDWDVAVLIEDSGQRTQARKALSVISLEDMSATFHLNPLVIPTAGGSLAPDDWRVSPALAHAVSMDGIRVA